MVLLWLVTCLVVGALKSGPNRIVEENHGCSKCSKGAKAHVQPKISTGWAGWTLKQAQPSACFRPYVSLFCRFPDVSFASSSSRPQLHPALPALNALGVLRPPVTLPPIALWSILMTTKIPFTGVSWTKTQKHLIHMRIWHRGLYCIFTTYDNT